MHYVPLSPQAVALLAMMRREADPDCPHVFVGNGTGRPVTTVRRLWLAACKSAGLAVQVEKRDPRGRVVRDAKGSPVLIWQTTARLHDLRHSYASLLVNSGVSLHIVGGLLGHSKPATTARYAIYRIQSCAKRPGASVPSWGCRPALRPSGDPADNAAVGMNDFPVGDATQRHDHGG